MKLQTQLLPMGRMTSAMPPTTPADQKRAPGPAFSHRTPKDRYFPARRARCGRHVSTSPPTSDNSQTGYSGISLCPATASIFQIHRVVIHLDYPKWWCLQMPPDLHRSSTTDHVATTAPSRCGWSADAQLISCPQFLDHKIPYCTSPTRKTANPQMLEERKNLLRVRYQMSNWHVLKGSGEVDLVSQRSD